MTLPNLLVIGAQKSGTTSLHRYLAAHPEVFMSTRKELDYFAGPGWNWEKGPEWYASHFAGAAPFPVRGESSPSYTMHPWVPGVPERIREALPDVRLIYVVRDPIERMLSQYVHYRTRGYIRRSFADLVADERFAESDYVLFSRYGMQLDRYLECFEESQLHVIAHEELLTRREETLTRLFRFLGVDEKFRSDEFVATYNAARKRPVQRALNRVSGGYFNAARFDRLARRIPAVRRLDAMLSSPVKRPALDSRTRDRITELVADDADRLRQLTGKELRAWSV